MALAKQELAAALRGEGCLGRAADDEPVFVLRSKDRFAPELVRLWAQYVENAVYRGEADSSTDRASKISEARNLADKMEEWQRANGRKVPD